MARQLDMPELLKGDGAFTVTETGLGAAQIGWSSIARSGREECVSVDLTEEGALQCDRPFAQWSAPPSKGSHVLVVPDVLTFFALRHAIGISSILPFVMTTPVPGFPLPGEWFDPDYWRFERVTILSDGLDEPAAAVGMFSEMALSAVGVACAAHGTTWRGLARRGGRFGYADLEAAVEAALPIDGFRRILLRGDDDLALIDKRCRRLDERGRLIRLDRDGAALGRPMRLIRSDRSHAALVTRRPVSVHPPATVMPGSEGSWGRAEVKAFLDGAMSLNSREIGRRLLEAVTTHLTLPPADARALCSYVALTYVFAGFGDLPLLIIRCEAKARIELRRLLKEVCNDPVVVSRNRAMQLARVADAGSGVMILDEPGPACGPGGATELGRFLESGVHRDASPYVTTSRTSGLRTFDVFGPKMLMAATATPAGLACASRTIEAQGGTPPSSASPLSDPADLRDALHAWSMAWIAASHGTPARCSSDDVLSLLEIDLFGDVVQGGVEDSPQIDVRHRAACAEPLSPQQLMEEVMGACGSAGHLSMIEVSLEVALRGGQGEEFSPERVGRWISGHPRVDRSRAVERRRLHGQISRIYPLVDDRGDDGDAARAFDFCLQRSCAECRFDAGCDSVMPELKSRKGGIRRPNGIRRQ